jgi:transcriptional regulator with XRE-family HTH domain
MHVGSAIRRIRKKVSLSQFELSQKCAITQTALSQIEVGVKIPSQRTLHKICNALDVPESIIYILGLQETDVSVSKKDTYNVVHPVMQGLILQLAQPEDNTENNEQ